LKTYIGKLRPGKMISQIEDKGKRSKLLAIFRYIYWVKHGEMPEPIPAPSSTRSPIGKLSRETVKVPVHLF